VFGVSPLNVIDPSEPPQVVGLELICKTGDCARALLQQNAIMNPMSSKGIGKGLIFSTGNRVSVEYYTSQSELTDHGV
jgi:hypothetical protein